MTTALQLPLFICWIMVVLGGLALGSFTTCAVYRLPRGLSIWRNRDGSYRSFCPSCGHELTGRDLVPVLSWLFQCGKCRYCAAEIGARYVLIELSVLLVVILLALLLDFTWLFIATSFCVPIIAVLISYFLHNRKV